MKYKVPPTPEPRNCCTILCDQLATWSIIYGPSPDDFTESCDAHAGAMIGDEPLLAIHRIQAPQIDHLDFVIDGPPGHTAGRFVELEGFYGAYAPQKIDSVGGPDIQWIKPADDDPHPFWRLRVPIPAGWLYG